MPRAIWKGVLRVGGARVPVALVSAVVDRDVHFRLLHEKDRTPIRQRLVAGDGGEEVPVAAARKGFPVAPGVFVVLTKDELDALEPPDARDIEVLRFVPPAAIGFEWYERPYWLVPGKGAEREYVALAEALAKTGRTGIVRWVMRDREHVGALAARERRLLLVTLRFADEVISRRDLEPPPTRPPTEGELRLARQLVAALEAPFDPDVYRDTHRERVLALIQAKAKGRKPHLRRPRRRAEARSLEAALRASLSRKERKRA
ncbi:MAG TPA: Ku protein [Candidatus Binatia bacterium]|nr:Ku protein [Candidatus Binatia bacterium]